MINEIITVCNLFLLFKYIFYVNYDVSRDGLDVRSNSSDLFNLDLSTTHNVIAGSGFDYHFRFSKEQNIASESK